VYRTLRHTWQDLASGPRPVRLSLSGVVVRALSTSGRKRSMGAKIFDANLRLVSGSAHVDLAFLPFLEAHTFRRLYSGNDAKEDTRRNDA